MKCPICFKDHNIKILEKCNIFLSSLLNKYLNIDSKIYLHEAKPYMEIKLKRHQCEHCFKILSTSTNYKKHIKSKICKNPHGLDCNFCGKEFKCRQNLDYHLEHNVCGLVVVNKILELENKNLNPVTANTANPVTANIQNQTINIANNTTNNIAGNVNNIAGNVNNIGTLNNNIQINVNNGDNLKNVVELLPFREMGYKVSTEKYLEYASNPEQAIKQFIKENHFNPEKPERMNVLNTNRRDNRVQLFDYDDDFIARWQTKDKAKIIELLYDRGMNHLFFAKMMLDGAGIKLDAKKEAKLKEKIKEYEDDKVKKKCLEMISDMTYDYREIVEENKKNIEKQKLLIK